MSRPRVTFAELRRMLLDMGFTETVVPRVARLLRPSAARCGGRPADLSTQPDRPAASSHRGAHHPGRHRVDGPGGFRRFRGLDLDEAIGFVIALRRSPDPPPARGMTPTGPAAGGRRPAVGSPRPGPVRSGRAGGNAVRRVQPAPDELGTTQGPFPVSAREPPISARWPGGPGARPGPEAPDAGRRVCGGCAPPRPSPGPLENEEHVRQAVGRSQDHLLERLEGVKIVME